MKKRADLIRNVRRYRTRLRSLSGWPELTALIDILFLALLVLEISSSFVRVSGISVELPRLPAPDTAMLERYIVTITPPDQEHPQGTIYYRDKPVDHQELSRRLSEIKDHSKQARVVIRADRRVPFSEVAAVMAIAEAEKLPSFIAVFSPDDRPGASFEKQDR